MPVPPPSPFALWSVSANGAADEAAELLAEAARRGAPTLVDLGQGQHLLGWHPLVDRFAVNPRGPEAPADWPRFMAVMAEARHVHAGGESPEAAAIALIDLVARVASQLEAARDEGAAHE